MTDAAPSSTRARIPAPLRWFAGSLRVHLVNAAQIPGEGAVFAVQRPYDGVAHAVYERHLPGRAVMVHLDAAGLAGVARPELDEGLDVLVPLDADPAQSRQQILDTLALARAASRPVFPVGLAVGSTVKLGADALPLPGARVVMIVEAPFHVPARPARIPSDWADAFARLLKQAGGRARDILATWKHTGQPPGR